MRMATTRQEQAKLCIIVPNTRTFSVSVGVPRCAACIRRAYRGTRGTTRVPVQHESKFHTSVSSGSIARLPPMLRARRGCQSHHLSPPLSISFKCSPPWLMPCACCCAIVCCLGYVLLLCTSNGPGLKFLHSGEETRVQLQRVVVRVPVVDRGWAVEGRQQVLPQPQWRHCLRNTASIRLAPPQVGIQRFVDCECHSWGGLRPGLAALYR